MQWHRKGFDNQGKKNMSYTWTILELILWDSIWAVWNSSEEIFFISSSDKKNGKRLKVVKQIIKYFLKKCRYLSLLMREENVSGYQVIS